MNKLQILNQMIYNTEIHFYNQMNMFAKIENKSLRKRNIKINKFESLNLFT